MTETSENEALSPADTAPPALESDAALALLRSAEADHQAGNIAAAKAACETLIAAGKLVEWAHFFLGRIYRDEANDTAAMAAFSHAIDADPTMFWAHCERLILARDLGEPSERRTELVDALVAIPWEPLQGGTLRRVELIAHAQWDDGHVADGHRLFEKLWPSDELDQLTLVRIIEANLDAELVAEAVKRLEDAPELDETAQRILLQHYHLQGDVGRQLTLLETRSPDDALKVQAWAMIARTYARTRKDRLASGNSNQSPEDAALIARLYDFGKIVETGEEPLPDGQVPQIESIAHVLWDAGYTDSAHRLFTRMWPSTTSA